MKKIIAINCSPRSVWNTAALARLERRNPREIANNASVHYDEEAQIFIFPLWGRM